MPDYKKVLQGRRSKATGDHFESMLNAACNYYRSKRKAIIEKTPEPMRTIKPYGDRRRGLYIACFEKQAQPDYKGVLCDGTAIIFEAKHTDGNRINQSVISSTQEDILNAFANMGAQCFVMVSIRFENFYRVPWAIFSSMKKLYGRKYMTEDELRPYMLQYKNGTVLFLEGVELYDYQEK